MPADLQHRWLFLASHGEDAPSKSLDSYYQCAGCGAVKHDYAHGGGQTSPNYPMVYKYGVPIERDAPCLGLLGAARSSIEPSASECRTPGCCSCPGMTRCPICGYTEHDKALLMDHRFCPAALSSSKDGGT